MGKTPGFFAFYCYTSETPPRAWGRREFANEGSAAHQKHPHERGEDWLLLLLSILTSGNTPTSVGKTDDWHEHLSYSEKHPHERGEDASKNAFSFFVMETPPRAWGRPAPSSSSSTRSRNTPTSVGKTLPIHGLLSETRKHPHERGEDSAVAISTTCSKETPPRAWGRPTRLVLAFLRSRNTPTSVGKTRLRFSYLFRLALLTNMIRRRGKNPKNKDEAYPS